MMDFWIRFIPFAVFLIPFVKSIRRKNAIAITITSLYLLSAFCSFFMDEKVMPLHNFNTDSGFVFLLYSLLLLPFLLLSLKIKPIYNVKALPKGPLVDVLIFFLFIGAIYSFVYLSPYAAQSLAMDAKEVKIGEMNLPPTIYTTIAVGFPTFYYLYLFLFLTCIVQKRPKIIAFGMLLGVLAFLTNIFVISGRDGVFFILFAFLLGYFMFKPLLLQKQIKNFKILFISLTLIGLFFIFRITTERFGYIKGFDLYTFKLGVLSYLGMQPFVFSDWIKYNDLFNYGNTHFGLFLDLVGASSNKSFNYNRYYTWKFGTFLTNFYAVSGYVSLIGISFLFWLYFKLNLDKLSNFGILALFFFLGLYFHFTISGVFYFRMGNGGGNLFLLLSIIAVFLLKKRRKS